MAIDNVKAYFRAKLGYTPDDTSLVRCSLFSECGMDCVRAIDSAYDLLEHLRATIGDDEQDNEHRLAILAAVELVVSVYWRG